MWRMANDNQIRSLMAHDANRRRPRNPHTDMLPGAITGRAYPATEARVQGVAVEDPDDG